jgi:hypothetical protein
MVCVKPHMKGPARIIAEIALNVSETTRPAESVVGASPKRFHTAW